MGHKEIIMILTLGVISIDKSATEPHGGTSKWGRPGIIPQVSQLPSQEYSNALMGIDQRLRTLDSIRHIISRTEISLQSLTNRMDLIETRLQTVQNSFQHTFEAVSTAVKSSEMKYELLIEQLSRKLESGIERLSHRLTTIESRNEASINKLQNQMDIQFSRVETKQTSIGNDVTRINSNVEAIRVQTTLFEERLNQTFLNIINQLKEIRAEHGFKKEQLRNITSLILGLNANRSEMFGLSDAPQFPQESLKMIRVIVSEEGHKIGAKLHNMYNDLWKTVKDLEKITKTGFAESNSTSRDLFNKLTELLMEEQRNSESFIDVVVRSVLTNVGELLGDLQRQFDNRFKEFKTNQEIHGESCHKIKSIIENRVAIILEKIYDTFMNRTDRFSKQVTDIGELLKIHQKQFIETSSDTNNILVTLADESSQDHKQLDNSIADVAETCQDLQVQSQELNDLLLKNEATIKDIKNILLSQKDEKGLLNVSSRGLQQENLHAIEANFSDGIIKIKANQINKNQGISKLKANPQDKEKQGNIPLEALNKTISTSQFVAVIGEPRKDNPDDDQISRERERTHDADFEAHKDSDRDEGKPIDVTQLLLAYIKLLHDHLSPQEFLAEAVPGNTYESFEDMIKHLRKANNVPRETIHDIEQLAQEQIYRDSQTDREIGSIIKKLQHSRDLDNEDENYDDEE